MYIYMHILFMQLMGVMERVCGDGKAKVVSLLEGGYDVEAGTQGLAKCVVAHVKALKEANNGIIQVR
jgi:acetoin utilization deacetylase AcuC-like enzyme